MFKYLFVQLPHGVVDKCAVIIDQQAIAEAVSVFGKTGQMNLAHRVQWQRVEVGKWIAPMVDARHIDVVYIQQQTTAGAADDFADEVGLRTGLRM